MSNSNHDVVIVGGGTAGITVAASLRRRAPSSLSIAIVEPAEFHYYQPAWTLVGAGAYPMAKTRRSVASLVPSGVSFIQDAVTEFRPDADEVALASGDSLGYGHLIVCPGIVLDWQKIAGLPESLGSNGVCSNYSVDHAEYTWRCIQQLEHGAKVICTQPPMPFKCPGAHRRSLISRRITCAAKKC